MAARPLTGDGRTAGFHLSSLYSPVGWFSWADAAEMYEQAQKTPDLMKGFVNTVLGLPFEEEAEAPEWQRLYERRESYRIGIVPERGSVPDRRRRCPEGPDRGRGRRLGPGQGELVGRLPGDRGRHRPARGLGEAGCGARSGLAARVRAHAADPGDVRRRRLCDPGRLRLGAAAPAGELGPGRRRGAAAAHGGGGQGPRPGHGAAALGLAGRCRRQAARAAGVVGRHAGRQGRAVPLAQAGVADGGGAGCRRELSARRLPLPAVRRGVLQAAHRRAAGDPDRQGLPARLVGEGAGPAQRGARLPGLRPGGGRDLRPRPVRGAPLAADGGSVGADG